MLSNSFEGGTNGVTLTTANTGGASGDAFSAVVKGATSGAAFSAVSAFVGQMGALLTHVSGEVTYLGYTLPAAAGRVVGRRPLYLPTAGGAPSANTVIVQLRDGANAVVCSLILGTDRYLYGANADGSVIAATKSAAVIPYDTLLWVEEAGAKGSTTSDGTVEWILYAGDGVTQIDTQTSGAAVNTGTADIASVRFGRAAASTWSATERLDDIAADVLASGWMPAPGTPIADAGAALSTVEPGKVTVHTGTVADSDGFVGGTVLWTLEATSPAGVTVDLTDETSLTMSYVSAPTLAGHTVTLGLTATDADSNVSAMDTITDTVLPATENSIDGAGVLHPVLIRGI